MPELALVIASERLERRKRLDKSFAAGSGQHPSAVPGHVLRAVDATIGWHRFGERAASCARGWWHMKTVPFPWVAPRIYDQSFPFKGGLARLSMTIRGYEVDDDFYRSFSDGKDPFENADLVWDWTDGKPHPQVAAEVQFSKGSPIDGWRRVRVSLDGLSAFDTPAQLHVERMRCWPSAQEAILRELREAWFPIGTDDELASAGGMPPALFAAIVGWWEVRRDQRRRG